MYALGYHLLHHRSLVGNTRTLYHLVGIEYLLLSVLALFPLYLVAVEHFLVAVFDFRHIAYKHVETFFLCQYGSSGTAFAGS